MADDSLVARVRGLWEQLAAGPVSFPANGGVAIAASPDSRLCPPSFAGVVRVGDAAIVTAPDDDQADLLREVLEHARVDSLVCISGLGAMLPVNEVLGPAALGYVSRDEFRPARNGAAIMCRAPGQGDVRVLVESVGPDDADESGIEEISSPVFVVCEGSEVLAAAGYHMWPASTAHLCVLTAPQQRGRGLARQVASAAVSHALDADLLVQWRARSAASRRVAAALGFRELGDQLSVRLGE
ncbi:GNAT family N-acetyltransferase [Streptomyces iconiensis]|uniref:GNAT family N-acetyltransferase n=1 Tax=Streptomyces iconiensis TaxID=1384038 RepID=A0ABT6ZPL6_9ACTN|nr:GNAT family N-acetyltransferase [Streptomyces iconiensis]MDJ1131003.1 GNAT family N-acetyltransferase [Streptomyces iconiensis]